MGGSSSRMTHFSDAKRRLASSVIRAVLGGGVSESISTPSEGIFEPCQRMALPAGCAGRFLRQPFSGESDFLMMSEQISHFHSRSMAASLAG